MHKIISAAVLSLACLACQTSAHAAAVDQALAIKFLEETKMDEIVKAGIDEYVNQLGKGATPEDQAKLRQTLEALAGWEVMKGPLVELVKQTYTQEEVNAYLAFVRTPAGASMTAKGAEFSRGMSMLSSERFKKLLQQGAGQ